MNPSKWTQKTQEAQSEALRRGNTMQIGLAAEAPVRGGANPGIDLTRSGDPLRFV
jgi:hypothetical protein